MRHFTIQQLACQRCAGRSHKADPSGLVLRNSP
jgi:hypothetical protein